MSKQAIDGKRLNAFGVDPNELIIVGLDTDDGNEHPLFDPRIHLPLSEALVRNIMVHGVLQTVTVHKDGERILVVAGRQRVRAAREANKRLEAEGAPTIPVPVMAKRGGDVAMLGVMISENEIRVEDLMESKLPKLEKLLDYGKTEEEAAVYFGVEPQTIKNWLQLLEAGPEVKEAVKKGLLSPTAGTQMASLPRSEQASAVQEVTANGKATIAKAHSVVRSKKRNAKNGTDDGAIVPPTKKVLRKLLESDSFKQFEVEPAKLLKWFLGDLASERVKGLNAILGSLE